jgi:hypothetical protein
MSAMGHRTANGLWWGKADVAALRDLVESTRPVVSMYLGVHRSDEDLDLRTRSLLHELGAAGVDRSTLDAVRSYSAQLGPEPAEHAIVARDGAIVYVRTMAGAAAFDRARFAAPPSVAPVLEWLFARPPHVVVLVHRDGAEITSVGGADGRRVTSMVVGPDDLITAVSPRGWSQPRFQRRVEDSWRHNASAVVDAALRAAHDVQAKLMFIAGDIRAEHLVREGLDRAGADVVVSVLPGGHTVDGGVMAAVAAAVAEDAETRMNELLQRLRDEGGPAGLATEGAAETLAALADRRVEVLVVVDDPADGRLAYCGETTLCSLARPRPADSAVHGRLVDVAVRAALLCDAHVCVVPATHPLLPAEGIGAICRYPSHGR